jgi:dihydrofolate reductase
LYVERSLEDAITKAVELRGEDDTQAVYLAGGGMLYKEALEKDLINTMLLSSIHDEHLCDTHFPDFDRAAWESYEMLTEPTFTVNLYTKKEIPDEPALYSS